MMQYIFLAILNGAIIGVSRTLNGRLSITLGPFKASFWNHLVGYLCLSAAFLVVGNPRVRFHVDLSFYPFLGGLFGALFVAFNSYVLSRIGAVQTIVLVICGQMISSTLIDYYSRGATFTRTQVVGTALIIVGACLARVSSSISR